MRLMRQRFLRPISDTRGAKRHRHALPQGQEAAGVLRQRAAQIVMTRKQPPRTAPATKDLKLDRRSPKTPPRERGRGHVDHPIRREPLGHVVVAGDGHEAAADLARADALGHAADTTRATLRSTTLVNSSKTTKGARDEVSERARVRD